MSTISSNAVEQVASKVGSCLIVFGTVRAISPHGVMRVLNPNSPVFLMDKIMTGRDGMVSILIDDNNGTKINLGRMSETTLATEMFGNLIGAENSEIADEIDQLHEGLLTSDIDPTIALDPPAAGYATNTYAEGGGGIHWIKFDLTDKAVTPMFDELETEGVAYHIVPVDPPVLQLQRGQDDSMPTEMSNQGGATTSTSLLVEPLIAFTDDSYVTSTYQDPQKAILVDEEGNFLMADMRLAEIDETNTLSIVPRDENGNPVVDGDQIFENGFPLLLNGDPVYWQLNDEGYWSAIVRRSVSDDSTNDHGDQDDHDEEKEYSKVFNDSDNDDLTFAVTITAKDYDKDGEPTEGWVHANGQGTGVGNPFVNMDENGSELLLFTFNSFPETFAEIKLGIDHLDGAKGNNPAEFANWRLYNDQDEVYSGQFEGSGQGSGDGSDQLMSISIPEELIGSTTLYLEMAYSKVTESSDETHACGQGYRISSFECVDGDDNSLFSALLNKGGGGHSDDSDHSDGGDDHNHEDSALEFDSEVESEKIYSDEILFTIYPETDLAGKYTGNYIVDQENAFHDNMFSFSLTGAKGGPQVVKNYTDNEVHMTITAVDHDHHTGEIVEGKVHANGQGMGVENPFINMDTEGSEIITFSFTDESGNYIQMKEVGLGIDHLSGAHGNENTEPEQAQWVAYTVDELGNRTEIASGLFDGKGQGSSSKSDQELVIDVSENDISQYFNELDMLFVASSSDKTSHTDDGTGEGSEDHDEVCGQGYRISSIEGSFNPGDHTFEFAVVTADGSETTTSATLSVTFDGDGDVMGTIADEVISGSVEGDNLNGGGGDDLIYGNDGDDIITGGAGQDLLVGGEGDDIFIDVTGNDVVVEDDVLPTQSQDVYASTIENVEVATDESTGLIDAGNYELDPLEPLAPITDAA